MLRRGLHSSLSAILLGLVVVGGVNVLADNQATHLTGLPSGKQIQILALGQAVGNGGKTKAIMLRYRTQKQITDQAGLASEADDVWDLFKIDADRSGLNIAVISAELQAADAITGRKQVANFVLDKNAAGNWVCRNDKTVGIGNPAKAAYRQGYRLFTQGHNREALESYNQAVSLDPTYVQSYVDLAGIYIVLGQLDKGLAACDKAISLMPTNAGAYCNRGIINSKLRKNKQAIDDFSNAIRLNPDFGLSYAGRGADYVKLGQYEQAVDDLNKAINMRANLGETFYYRAVALEKVAQGDRQRSIKLGYHPTDVKAIAEKRDLKHAAAR